MKDTITKEDKNELVNFIQTSDRYTNGPKVREFEEEWSKWLGTKYSLMVSSGSTANFLLLAAVKEKYGLKDGDKVLVPAVTWVTNISPIFQNGLVPVFCDVNTHNLSFDEDGLVKARNDHPDVKMVFITHLMGFSSDIGKIKKHFPDAIILEDVCESHGTEYQGVRCGTFGVGSTFSFYFGHHMTTIEGGVVSTNDYELYNLMRAKRSHGLAREMDAPFFENYKNKYPELHPQFLFVTDAYNFRSSEFNAVLGLSQLKRLDDNIEVRRQNFAKFLSIISSYDFLQSEFKVEGNSNFNLPFLCSDKTTKQELENYLTHSGVETRPIISGNLARQPFLNFLGLDPLSFEKAEELHQQAFYIGNSHLVDDNDFSRLESLLKLFPTQGDL